MSTDRLEDKATTESLIDFFKAIPEDWYNSTSGNVEAPCGWFGLVVITDEFITAWDEEDLADMAVPKEVAKGRYLVVINNAGLVWAYTGEDKAIDAESASREAQYAEWDTMPDTVPLQKYGIFGARYVDNVASYKFDLGRAASLASDTEAQQLLASYVTDLVVQGGTATFSKVHGEFRVSMPDGVVEYIKMPVAI